MMPAATIVITTRNRREDLRRAIRSAVQQRGVLLEVLVIDDGSTDGTAEMVQSEFSSVCLERRQETKGYIVRRNEAARLARGAVIFSIDDDAEFSTADIVAQALAQFEDPWIGALAIPFINVLRGREVFQSIPEDPGGGIFVTSSFIGTAHALRRDVFLNLGGYREQLIHQGEERDYCLRMLAAGFVVRLARTAPIFHYESPRRNVERMDFYGRRNDVLFAWQNVPMPFFPIHLAATIVKGTRYAITQGSHPFHMAAGLVSGCLNVAGCRATRNPVPVAIYRLHRFLKRAPATELHAIRDKLRR